MLNTSIWSFFDEKTQPTPHAPNLIFIALNGAVLDVSEEIKLAEPATVQNHYSIGCIISHGKFKFYTAGDLCSS